MKKIALWVIAASLLVLAPMVQAKNIVADEPLRKGVPIVTGGRPAALIVVGEQPSERERLAGNELQRYIQKLTGATLKIIDPHKASANKDKSLLVVGEPNNNSLVDQILKGKIDPRKLKPEDFVLHTGQFQGRSVAVISGHDGIGTLYGSYALLERLGITFLLTGDLLPKPVADLSLSEISQVFETAFPVRGFQIDLFDLHSSIWDLADYQKLIDQMVKMRLNYLSFCQAVAQPFVEYTYRGEKSLYGDVTSRESGYLRMKHSTPDVRVSQVKIGIEHFKGRKSMAPMILQDVKSSGEAVRLFSGMMQEVLRYAKSRGFKTGMAFDSCYMVPNLGRFARKSAQQPQPFLHLFGMNAYPTDTVALEIFEQRLKAILHTYPDINYLFVFNSENYEFSNDPENQKLYERMRPHFAGALPLLDDEWASVCQKFGKTPDKIIDADIGVFDTSLKVVESAKRLRPDLKIGMGFLFRGFLLQSVDKLVSRDIPFIDWQSSGVFPLKSATNAMYFANMGDRERLIIPRIDDDGSMFGIPFYLRQYQKDGLFNQALQAGVSGFAGQMYRARGTEHHTRFLAQASWQPDLTPEAFYQGYARDVFGPAAAEYMAAAFDILEENDKQFGNWRGLGNFSWDGISDLIINEAFERLFNPITGPPNAADMCRGAQAASEPYKSAVKRLERALAEMEKARSVVSSKGEPMLTYLISKTGAYKAHLEMLALLNQAYAAYAQSFVEHADDEPALAASLAEAEKGFSAAEAKAEEAAQRAAEIVDHPSDLAILFLANTWDVAQVKEVITLVHRTVNYHSGRPYWSEIGRDVSFHSGPSWEKWKE